MRAATVVTQDNEGWTYEGIGCLRIAMNKDGEQYSLVTLGGHDKKNRQLIGIPNDSYRKRRRIVPDEEYTLFPEGGLFSHSVKAEKEGALLVLWQAEKCERIEVDGKNIKVWGYYSGMDGDLYTTMILAVLDPGKGLKGYPLGDMEGQKKPILVRNENGKLAIYKDIAH